MASGGFVNSLALLKDGTVRAWGADVVGQLGNGEYTLFRDLPVTVSGLPKVRAVASGEGFGLALLDNRTVMSWGFNNEGQLGNPAIGEAGTDVPIEVIGLRGVASIAAGDLYVLARMSDGSVLAWGENLGTFGNGTFESSGTPVPVPALQGAAALSGGGRTSIGLVPG